jgi:hypothetical protein
MHLRLAWPVALAALTSACAGAAGPETAPAGRAARAAVLAGRPAVPSSWTMRAAAVSAPNAMVASAHPLATAAGV